MEVNHRPSCETDYHIPESAYYRRIYQCNNCKAYVNFHNLLDETFYTGEYNKAIKLGTLTKRFEKIIAIPFEKSDNKQRVGRILKNLSQPDQNPSKINILDVGSGTSVFLHELKKYGFYTASIDPDMTAVEHAIENVGVDMSHHGNLFDFRTNLKFDLISFNKVLEHLKNPVEHLQEAKKYLKPEGRIYIELPEGDRIVVKHLLKDRAEFAIEHYVIFNSSSIGHLIEQAGMKNEKSEVITDPSGKYTIYAFLKIE